jgi:hypothetical protein
LGWCEYDPRKVSRDIGQKNFINAANKNKKTVFCINNSMTFESLSALSKQSISIFGINLSRKGIAETCNGKRKNYKGYKFTFI